MKIVEVDQHTAINVNHVIYYTIYPNDKSKCCFDTKKITIYFTTDIAPLVVYVDDYQALRFNNAMLNAGGY